MSGSVERIWKKGWKDRLLPNSDLLLAYPLFHGADVLCEWLCEHLNRDLLHRNSYHCKYQYVANMNTGAS